MTCVVGFTENGITYLGGDSLGSNGYSKTTYLQRKVFKSQNTKDLIIGLCGSFNFQGLEYEDLIDELDLLKNSVDRKYLITKFIPKLKSKIELHNANSQSNNINSMFGELLFGYKDKLFKVQSDYSLLESSNKYQSIGSGEHFALGTLFALESQEMTPQERIHLALQSASKFAVGVAAPFYVINTENDEVVEFLD